MQFAVQHQSLQLDPGVVAALIAAVASSLSLGVQVFGIRRVSNDTNSIVRQQLDQQREQLGRTLAQERLRTLNERFATAADRLGTDKPAAVRLAAVYAMAGLADDWAENRQTCVDVLCAYLRMPYAPDPGEDAPPAKRLEFGGNREVRQTVIRVITARLRQGALVPWQGLNFDFTGVRFDGGDFGGAVFSGGQASFDRAVFSSGQVSFVGAVFSGGQVSFEGAAFSGGEVHFASAAFSGGQVSFDGAKFSGLVSFGVAEFSGGQVSFVGAEISGGRVSFVGAKFSGGQVNFFNALFSGGQVNFFSAYFSGSQVRFDNALFSGGQIGFVGAAFAGGLLDISRPKDWSHPPIFGIEEGQALVVKMPETQAP